jgi:undecaprenyl-diphosphatase
MSTAGTNSLSSRPMLQFINRRDHALMRRIHRWHAPRWVRLLLIFATRGGDGWLWYPLGFGILLSGNHARFAAVGAGLSSSGVGLAIYTLVKKSTRRKRPCLVEPNPWAQVMPPDQYSFPSGHTIAAFSIATSVGLFYPSLLLVLLCLALIIAASRIMLGMHFLSDVVAGMLLGTSLGYTAFLVIR